jgi:hypothetical protein
METFEEIEDFYKKEMEKLDQEFLDSFKKNLEIEKIKSQYETKLIKLKEEYEKRYSKYLEEQKKDFIKQRGKKIQEKKEKKESFNVERLNLELTKKEKFQLRYDMFRFRSRIKLSNILRRFIPNLFLINFIRIKLWIKRVLKSSRKYIQNFTIDSKKLALNLFDVALKSVKYIYILIKRILSSVLFYLLYPFRLFKKKEKSEAEKRPDEIIAEKLLKKEKKD